MLKIKDNVDLKELEKFGFKEIDEFGAIDYCYYKEKSELKISMQRIICIDIDCEKSLYENVPDEILNILYDLIKADLVEKVEDKGESNYDYKKEKEFEYLEEQLIQKRIEENK